MLSRVANAIYWMCRYIERAENYGRFINVNSSLALDSPSLFTDNWRPLLTATADEFAFSVLHDKPTRKNVIDFMTFEPRNPNSIYSCVAAARQNARTIREVLPSELWVQVNSFYLQIKEKATRPDRSLPDPVGFYEEIRQGCQLFWGMIDAAYTRHEGYYFASLGKFIERADKTSRFLDISYFTSSLQKGSPEEFLILTAVLKSISAFNMFRQQFRVLDPPTMVSFLVKDSHFPRSLFYCLQQAEICLYAISGQPLSAGFSNMAEQQVSLLRSDLTFTDISSIYPDKLHDFLSDFQARNNALDIAVFEMYFRREVRS